MRRLAVFGVALFLSSGLSLGGGIASAAATGPAVYGIDPNIGSTAGGTEVAIFGNGFTGTTSVKFGANSVRQFFVADDHRIFTNSPPGPAGPPVDVTVTTPAATSTVNAADRFTYASIGPTLNAVDPRQGTADGGTNVTLLGSGLSGAQSLSFGGITIPCNSGPPGASASRALRMERALATNRALTPSRGAQPAAAAGGGGGGGGGQTSCFPADDGRLFVNSPPGTAGQTVDVTVTTPRGTSQTGAGTKFSYVPPTTPVVNALSPNHGTANGTTQVTIFGSGLSGATQVSFGGTMVPNCNAQASAVRTLRPQSRTRWVQVGRRTLTSKSTRAPLTSLEGGGPSQCFVPSGSDTMLTVPSAAGTAGQTVHVTVTSAAGTSAATNADFFKYTQPGAPAVDAVDPNHGTAFGGNFPTIFGSSLTGATAVHFGSVDLSQCSNTVMSPCFFPSDDSSLFVNGTPPKGTQAADIEVSVTVGTTTSATGAAAPGDKYHYDAPTAPQLDAIDPTHGSQGGGTNVTLFGSGFNSATTVTFGSTNIPACPQPPQTNCFFTFGDGAIGVSSPGGSPGAVAVRVTNSVGASGSIDFTYDPFVKPAIKVVSPNSGPITGGTSVYLTGSGFSGATHVTFGGSDARFMVPFGSDSVIQVTSPPTNVEGPVNIQVTGPAGSSDLNVFENFTYTPAPPPSQPSVTAVNPSSGASVNGGDTVYITGSGFNGDLVIPSSTSVTFGGQPAGFNAISDNLIQATAPDQAPGTTTVDVVVTNQAGSSATSANSKYTYGTAPPGPPVVSGVTPNQGTKYGGTFVQVFGAGFNAVTTVFFGPIGIPSCASTPGSGNCFMALDDNHLFVQNPPGTAGTTTDITVTTGTATSPVTNADKFGFVTPGKPIVNAVSPSQGSTFGGDPLAIFGSNLAGATGVNFGGAGPYPSCNSNMPVFPCFDVGGDNMLFLQTPQHPAGTVDVTVTSPEGTSDTSSADNYTFVTPPPPAITRVSPNTGGSSGGTTVYISGTNLQGFTQVSFGPNQTFLGGGGGPASPDVLIVSSPPGPANTTVDVRVTTPVGTSPIVAADRYHYTQSPAPKITAVSPGAGPAEGGTQVYITGTDLMPVNNLSFGATPAFNFFPMSPNLIQALSPAGPPGTTAATVDVKVTTPAGTSATGAADHFNYAAPGNPTVTAISPGSGPVLTQVFISGSDFGNTNNVNFGPSSSFGFFSPSVGVLTATSPPGNGIVDVTVTTPVGSSAATGSDKYTYTADQPPVVAAISPSQGPSGTAVYISGSNLSIYRPADTVTFGTAGHSPFFMPLSPGVIRANSPPADASAVPVDVTVTTAGGTSAPGAADLYTFTAQAQPTISALGPNQGVAGTPVWITGTGLGGTKSVKFGSATATNLFIRSDTLIRANAPAGSGTVDVTVTNSTGTSATSSADQFTYGAVIANPWRDTGGLLASGPAAVASGSGHLDAFVRGTDNRIWHLNAVSGAWDALGVLTVSSDAAPVATGTGTFDVFARGAADNALYEDDFDGASWSGWVKRGGLIAGTPAAVALGGGKIDVFVQGTDNKLWYDSFDGASTWTWYGVGGVLAAAPAAVSAAAGSADAFVMGSDSHLWHWANAPTTAGTWTFIGGGLASKPAATSSSSGTLDVFVQGTDTHLWHWAFPGGWTLVGGGLGSAPSATSWGGGRLDAAVRGLDGKLWHAWSTGGAWSWEGLGGVVVGAPAVATWGVGRLDIFVRGGDNHLWHLPFGS